MTRVEIEANASEPEPAQEQQGDAADARMTVLPQRERVGR
jgi:hypothetical protein